MKIENYKYKLHGRFKGRKKNQKFSEDFFKVYKKLEFNALQHKDKNKYNILDVGSGSGENALKISNIKKNSQIITCELYEDGNINLCNEIILNKINNIALFKGNVIEFLDKLEIEEFFDEVWILFPDPWPKKRHHKRRLISKEFLLKIHKYIKKSGKLMIASDSKSYLCSILATVYVSQKIFIWENQRFELWHYPNLDLPRTKFYEKALKLNRNSVIFKLNKI